MLLSCLLSVALGAVAGVPSLAVSDFTSSGATSELASAVGGVAGNELARLGVFRVQTADATRVLLGVERQRQLLGCGEGCQNVDLSALLGFDFLVMGKVSKALGLPGAGATFTLELSLLEVKSGQRLSSELVSARSESALVASVGPAAVKLVGRLLQGRQGSFILSSSEAGAAVKVDGSIVGTTPLEGRRPLAAGPHLLSVEKAGYVTWEKEVRIAPDAVSEESARLVPSPDTIERYEASARRMRLGAWLTTAVAVAGAGTFAAFQVRVGQLYGDPSREGTFQYHRAQLELADPNGEAVDHRAAAGALAGQIQSSQLISYVGAGVAGAATVGALYFWIAGESPDRYARFKEVRVAGGPTPGGGAAAFVAGRF